MGAGSTNSTSASAAVNGITAATATGDSCGYSGTSTSTTAALNTVVFNESGTAKAVSLGGNPSNPTVNFYYSDEHALTLGATSNGGVVSPFTNVYGTATNPYGDFGLKSDATGIAGRTPLQVGDPTAKDTLHRPIYPSAFVTDVTGLSTSSASYRAGDWQSLNTPSTGATGAQPPDFVAGTWKVFAGASVSVGDPGSGNPLTVGTTNGLGPNADNFPGLNIPGATSLEKYTSETRWHASGMKAWDPSTGTFEANLMPGHTYRVQVIAHDGDQNKTGGDTGEACAVISLPGVTTTATGQAQINTDGTATVSDTATVTGLSAPLPSGTNEVTFKVYGPDPTQGTDSSDDCTAANFVGTHHVALNSSTPSGQYPTSYTVNSAGDYHFTADLVIGGVTAASSLCGAANETATVGSRPTSLTTDAGGPYQPTNSLTDVATIHNGTSTGGGTITFKLFADNGSGGCGTQIGTDQVVPVNNGANEQQYSATVTNAAIHPGASGNATFHWTADYSGDVNNGGSSSGCGANLENPVVLYPHINIDKSPKNQTIENVSNGGGTATWTITVTNDGNAQETNVVVTDAVAPGCAKNAAATLPLIQGQGNHDSVFNPGESFSYTCSLSGLTGTPNTLHNVAVTTATSGNTTVTDDDFADVLILNPEIDVLKTPATQSVVSGGTAHFTIAVTNIGDVYLTGVSINDALSPDCARTAAQTLPLIQAVGNHDSRFDVGESFTYNCSLANVTAPFTNIVQACGTDQLSTQVCDDNNNGGNPPPGCPEATRCGQVGIESMASLQDPTPNDKGTVTVTGGNPPNGSLQFKLYAGACTGTPLYNSGLIPVNGSGSAATSNATKLSVLLGSSLTDGTYNWQITYSGDSNGNPDITGACGTEHFPITNS